MSLPSLEKTYEFSINNAVAGDATQVNGSSDATNDRKSLMLGIVNAFLDGGTFTVPWVVRGSSDASVSGIDAVNRWATIADLRWNVGTDGTPPNAAHSWIILYNSALDVELLIDCSGNANTDGACLLAYVSKLGFGVANGGTDGSALLRPTATDECTLMDGINDQEGSWSGNDNALARNWKWHVMASDDGEVWNVLIYQTNVLTGFWRFERPRNPPSNWAEGVIALMAGYSDDTNHADNDDNTGVQSGARGWTHVESGRRAEGLTQLDSNVRPYSWGWGQVANSRCGHTRANVVHPVTGNPVLWPFIFLTRADGVRGRAGRATDIWIKTNTVGGTVGDTHPANAGTPQFIVLSGTTGGLVLPWDGATTPQTS